MFSTANKPGQVVADARAIVDDSTPLRLVDEDAHHPAAGHVPVDQFVPHQGQRLRQQFAQFPFISRSCFA